MRNVEQKTWSLLFKWAARGVGLIVLVALIFAGVHSVRAARESIRLGRIGATLSDIERIEHTLRLVMADSGCSNLSCLLDTEAIRGALGVSYGSRISAQQMQMATSLYSNVYARLLEKGRAILDDADLEPSSHVAFKALVDASRVRKLAPSYMKVAADPWGTPFSIFPGPWPTSNGPIPFRSAWPRVGDDNPAVGERDELTLHGANVPSWLSNKKRVAIAGLPVGGDRFVYIWSLGKDLLSGQALYSPEGYAGDPRMHYFSFETGHRDAIGGGDDVNNWDQNQYYDF